MKPKEASKDLLKFGEFEMETFTAPDGKKYTIREQNGEDEDVLSKVSKTDMLAPIHNFLSRVIVEPNLSPYAVEKLKNRVKYYILLRSRIFSLGHVIAFEHTFKNDPIPTLMEQDLTEFIWDFDDADPFPKNPSEMIIKPYPKDAEDYFLFELSSGVECRMQYANGIAEKKVLAIPEKDLSINVEILARGFEIKREGEWIAIENFKTFTSRQMGEIREQIRKNDPDFTGIVEVSNGDKIEFVNILTTRDFFFPANMRTT